jgi:NADPH:quinone reductase-like Zn-dependent oxidoreductase
LRQQDAGAAVFALPDADPKQLAMLTVNPASAYAMLTDYVTLREGDWIIQSGPTSGVGRAVIALARRRGIRTVNVARRTEAAQELKELGADVVLMEGADLAARAAAATGGGRILLALDCVGDETLMALNSCLAPGGTLVTYGGIKGKPGMFSVGPTIFRDLTLRGFWLVRWFANNPRERVEKVLRDLADLISNGTIKTPVAATYPLHEIDKAISHAEKLQGKVLLEGTVNRG